ncbi:MAG: tyrosine-type recombinase/integrase, partial [Rhodospirillaceae bacterium]
MTSSDTGNDLTVIGSTTRSITAQAETDAQVVALWLRSSNSSHTRRARGEDARRFMEFVGKPLIGVTVGDLQAYAGELVGSDSTRARRLNNVKSLLSFGHRIGYLPFNVGSVVKSAAVKDTLAERIIAESEVHHLIAHEANPRNKVLLTLTYGAGLRISEVVGLTWRDCVARDDAGQITVFGKGGKTRVVLLSKSTWRAMAALRGGAGTDDPVFWSR